MCGIAGKIKFNAKDLNEQEFCEIRKRLTHRGPDGSGIKIFQNIALIHTRLSIIDLPGGTQPMSNEDQKIWIIFNGEIYNYREIRKSLIDKGHEFKTNSDTEVIIHLYEEEGNKCLDKLNGMFAFAILDLKKNILFLARDRLGQKPLYYFKKNDTFAFASELSSLKLFKDFPCEKNLQALHAYFSLQYIPCPMTAYAGVNELPPAHYLELDMNKETINSYRYWRLDFSAKDNLSEDEAVQQLYDLLIDSVSLRLISDVPIGVFLSGGVDSSIVTALMADLGVSPLRTFTVGFTEKLYDERYNARKISAKFATCHFEKMGDPSDFGLLEKLISNIGEPYADSSILPTALISEFAGKEVKVVLGGDGADEIFCGYNRYTLIRYASIANLLPLAVRKPILALLSAFVPTGASERSLCGKLSRVLKIFSEKKETQYYRIIVRFDEELKKNLYGETMRDNLPGTDQFLSTTYENLSSPHKIERYSELDINTYLNGDILRKLDIASMAYSLEARSPFLDYRIAKFAASLPFEIKQKATCRKYLLKKTFRGIIPDEILDSGKKGFGVPIADWLRGKWKKLCVEYIINGRAVQEKYLSKTNIEKLFKEHCEFTADHSYAIFAILCFSLWLESER